MTPHLLHQAASLFDSADKWSAFIELANQKESIKKYWLSILAQALSAHNNGLGASSWNIEITTGGPGLNVLWSVRDSPNPVCWRLDNLFFFGLSIKGGRIAGDIEFIKANYSSLLKCLGPIEGQSDGDWLIWERREYKIGQSQTPFDLERMFWFAGNETIDLVNQINERVARFTSPEMTNELAQLNQELINRKK